MAVWQPLYVFSDILSPIPILLAAIRSCEFDPVEVCFSTDEEVSRKKLSAYFTPPLRFPWKDLGILNQPPF